MQKLKDAQATLRVAALKFAAASLHHHAMLVDDDATPGVPTLKADAESRLHAAAVAYVAAL